MNATRLRDAASLLILLAALAGLACAKTTPQEYPVQQSAPHRYMVDGRNYTFAIYDSTNQLITHPIEDLRWRLRQGDEGITDVFVVAHGWNYTVPEAIANYYRYIDLVDEQAHPELGKSFRPYFIFVVWPSVIRPMRDAARSILPFQLDRVVAPLTKKADDWVFRLPTAWKQSLNAYNIALGERPTEFYRQRSYDAVHPYSPNADAEIGRDLPVSCLVHELIRLREDGGLGPRDARIHTVGHSYGAKLITLSAVEALRRHAAEIGADPAEGIPHDLIESLVMVNPAFHPRELFYVSGFDGAAGMPSTLPREELESALRSIPRKAVVYSRLDHANGAVFAISQLLLNNLQVQTAHAAMNNLTDTMESSGGVLRHASAVVRPVGGIAQVGWSIGTAPLQAGAGALANLVPDFVHHVRDEDRFEVADTRWLRTGMNAVHFFLPFDELLDPESDSDRLGIFRLSTPAIGSTGLSQLASGRPDLGEQVQPELDSFDNLGPLDGLAPPEAQRHTGDFVRLAKATGVSDGEPPIGRDVILSFDASRIYNTRSLPKGAHTDLGSHEKVDVGDGPLEKRFYTYNFLFNFTLCVPTASRGPRAICKGSFEDDLNTVVASSAFDSSH